MSETAGSLLAKTARGTGWVVAWRLTTRLLGLLSTVILARLLVPQDFGLVALATGLAATIETLSNPGVQDAMMRETHLDRALYDTGFTLNLLRMMATALIIAASAGPVCVFFSEPRLEPVLWALAASTALNGFENIRVLDFRRDFAFHREFLYFSLPRIIQVVVTVGCALAIQTYWALIAGITVARLGRLVFGYLIHPHRPSLTLRSWRGIFGFSLWTWLIGLATAGRDRSDTFIIGRMLGPTAIGVYAVGQEIAVLPATELVEPLCRAAFPGFLASRRSGLDTGQIYLRIIGATAFLSVPMGVGLSLVADPVVALAFGPKWAAARHVIEVLGVMTIGIAAGNVSQVLMSAHGRLSALFRVAVAAAVLRVVLLVVLLPHWGLAGGVAAVGVAIAAEHALNVTLAMREMKLPPSALLRCLWRPLLAAAGMAAVMVACGLGWSRVGGGPGALIVHLVRAAGLGAAVYGLAVMGAWAMSGRPKGAESDLVEGLRRVFLRVTPAAGAVPVPLRRNVP